MSTGRPFTNVVAVEVKKLCCSDGARKPVESETLRAKAGLKS
jgi:hypothetical protein